MSDTELPVAYTVVRADSDDLETPMWATDDGQQGLPLFTSEERAKLYLDNLGMTEGFRPTGLSLGDFYRWVVPAFEQGTSLAGVDWTGEEEAPVAIDVAEVLRDAVEQLMAPAEGA